MTAARSDFDLVQTGRGPDLLLLHSLLTDRTVFDPIVPRLARARRVTALNLPGFGASTPAGPRIEDYADRVADLFAALPLAPGADVIGMSFGGFVATALAARHGARIRRLAPGGHRGRLPRGGQGAAPRDGERALATGMDAVVDTAVRRMFTDVFIAARPDVIERQAAVLRRARPEGFAPACGGGRHPRRAGCQEQRHEGVAELVEAKGRELPGQCTGAVASAAEAVSGPI